MAALRVVRVGVADGELLNAVNVRRPVGRIAPVERRVALRELAAECPGATGEELVRLASDVFGWARLGQDIRAALFQDITALFAQGALTGGPDRTTVA